ncbi:MAG: 2-phospho-L-lactate guanylyltransferase [Pseudorhodoplanes sp.]|nr:2-phospho-L-lactate guanylyltransferase [Pseudorhodoplanes sp.]
MMDALFLIPCKPLAAGKSRLSAVMTASQRRDFCQSLLDATLTVARGLVAADRIRVVTADPAAVAVGRRFGAEILHDHFQDLNRALDAARNAVAGEPHTSLVVLPIDLPFATPEAIRACVEVPADVALATDLAGAGTNLLALKRRAAVAFPFLFGPSSLAAHSASARRLKFSLHVSRDPRLTFDIDEPVDLPVLNGNLRDRTMRRQA